MTCLSLLMAADDREILKKLWKINHFLKQVENSGKLQIMKKLPAILKKRDDYMSNSISFDTEWWNGQRRDDNNVAIIWRSVKKQRSIQRKTATHRFKNTSCEGDNYRKLRFRTLGSLVVSPS